ncbi:MAG: hypothetical protein HY343_13675 [Lentisphaerae bacterium]|nr:hypothetical protein [Lentisphaerota bacterium]
MTIQSIGSVMPWRSSSISPAMQSMASRLEYQNRLLAAQESVLENRQDFMRTADGWSQSIQNMLGRMGELAIMANDSTRSSGELSALQEEFSSLQSGIQSITSGPYALGTFNGTFLFQA